MDNRTIAWIKLGLMRFIGPVKAAALVDALGSPENIFKAKRNDLAPVTGIGPSVADRIIAERRNIDVDKELEAVRRHGVTVITVDDGAYPQALKSIYDPPYVLYVKGGFGNGGQKFFAMVGTRRPSEYGKESASKIARALARAGLTVVSGMARGIDTVSHAGAIDAGGRTIAVLGTGVDVVYPPENGDLYERIAENGAVISEFPMGTAGVRQNFPRRNRIISGLSSGVLVVEAGIKSGALITAEFALEQGREVFSLPGRIDDERAAGTIKLIKEGAVPVTGAQDIMDTLGETVKNTGQSATVVRDIRALSENEKAVFDILSPEPIHVDTMADRLGVDQGTLMSALLGLQIKKVIKEMPGKRFVKMNSN